MQLSPQTIRQMSRDNGLITPFKEHYQHEASGLSGGLSCAGYDIHVADIREALRGDEKLFSSYPTDEGDFWHIPPHTGVLGVTVERFRLPNDVAMTYYNKSTMARWFLDAAATLGEPGWHGYLTLEIRNSTDRWQPLYKGQPIGQVVFNRLDEPSDAAYSGKYQNQAAEPVQGLTFKEAS